MEFTPSAKETRMLTASKADRREALVQVALTPVTALGGFVDLVKMLAGLVR